MKTVTLALLLLISNILFSQDIITTKDSINIEAKVLDVDTKSIRYKKFSNMDGPTYNLLKSEILKVKYQNGEIEVYTAATLSKDTVSLIVNNIRKIFIRTTADSDVQPTLEVWKEEIERYPQLKKVENIDEADLIFEFKIKRAMGEARVSVNVLNSKNNSVLWESSKYRGTANVYNRMGASLHGIRKCFEKGILQALNEGKF